MTDPARTQRRKPGRPRNVTPSAVYLQRRAQIVEVAAQVFQAKGYDAGSLEDVGAALGLRKASLYYYVRSKAELLYLVFDRAISGALADLEQIVRADTPAQGLERLLRHQIQTVASDPGLFAVFFDQRPRLNDDYEKQIRAKERRYLGLYMDTVTAAIEGGVICASDPRYAAQLLLGMANWTYKWVNHDHDDVAAVADAAVRLILRPPSSPG